MPHVEVNLAVDHHQNQKAVWEMILFTVFGTTGLNGAGVLLIDVVNLALKHVHDQSGNNTHPLGTRRCCDVEATTQ